MALADIPPNIFAGVIVELLASSLRAFRQRHKADRWTEELTVALREAGVDLSAAEGHRMARWLRESDVDHLASLADGGSVALARLLSIEIFEVDVHTRCPPGTNLAEWAGAQEARATDLTAVLWNAAGQLLTQDERDRVRRAVAERHSDELAVSLMAELGWLRDQIQELPALLAPDLPLERARLRPPAGSKLSPYELLWPRFGVVPYDDRQGRLRELFTWCEEDSPISVQVIYAPGGFGKTRLALELCVTVARRGWIAGLYNPSGAAQLGRLASLPLPRLVVVDYADERITATTDLLSRLSDRLPIRANRVRVVLLVRRHASSGDARRIFMTGQGLPAHLVGRRSQITLPPWSRQDASASDLSARHRLFDSAIAAFERRGLGPAQHGQAAQPDLSHGFYSSPLFITAAALLALDPTATPRGSRTSTTREDILDQLLDREQARHWHDCPAHHVDRRRAVAVATLYGADDEDEMVDHLTLVPGLAGEGGTTLRHQLASWLHGMYLGVRWVAPLEPDLLGEHLVATELTPAMVDRALSLGASPSGVRAVAILARVGAGSEAAALLIRPILGRHLRSLTETALEQESTAMEWGSPGLLAGPLAELVASIRPDISDVDVIISAGPETQVLSYRVGVCAVEQLRQRTPAGLVEHRSLLAAWLNSTAVDLGALAQPDAALAMIEQAVGLYETLAELDPDTFLPLLGRSLNNHAVRLGALGRLEDALAVSLRTVELRRRLVADNSHTHLPMLARSLNNLATRHLVLGDRVSALKACEESVAYRRDLVGSDPTCHTPGLVHSLRTLSMCRASFGPDPLILPPIAEALALSRELARQTPSQYIPELASSLYSMAWHLGALGQYREGLQLIRDAVEIRQRLVVVEPNRHLRPLGLALARLSLHLKSVEEGESSAVARHEALAILNQLDR